MMNLIWVIVIICIVGSIAMGILNFTLGNMPMVALMAVCLVISVIYSAMLYGER